MISILSRQPWLSSACPRSAVPAGMPVIRLADHGPAKLRQEKTALAAVSASAYLGSIAADRGYVPVSGTPAVEATPFNELTQPSANGGLRGSHPWRDPVIT